MTYLEPKEDERKNLKVPMFKKQGEFVVWSGGSNVKYFSDESLPDVVKVKLGIIMASPHAAELNNKEMSNTDFEQSNMQNEIYMAKFGPDYVDIGWQYNKYYYCVVLTPEEMKSIQAGSDTRIESQE